MATRRQPETTTGFQLQVGPDGACRLLVQGTADDPTATLAILALDGPTADRLAQELTDRRKTYQAGRQQQGGPVQ